MSQGKPFDIRVTGNDRPTFLAVLRRFSLVLPLLLGLAPAAQAQVSVGVGIDVPGVSIGINLPFYPDLQRVPGYPVYYAPRAAGNYFYYDGLYWVFQGDHWYASRGYNGPWRSVMPLYVPAYVLRVPVQYYRQPPPYFRPWRADAPPRWDQHWGREWHQRRPGWDRRAAPPPAPLPAYQRRDPESRYPQERDRQSMSRAEHFDDKPREPVSNPNDRWRDRSPPHPQVKPEHRAEPRPGSAPVPVPRFQPPDEPRPRPDSQQSPRQPDRPHAAPPARPQAVAQDPGRPQGRAEASNPRQDDGRGDRMSDRSPRHQPFKPVEATAQPRTQPHAQQSPRPQNRPAAAQPSNAPRPHAAPQDRGRPQARAQAS